MGRRERDLWCSTHTDTNSANDALSRYCAVARPGLGVVTTGAAPAPHLPLVVTDIVEQLLNGYFLT